MSDQILNAWLALESDSARDARVPVPPTPASGPTPLFLSVSTDDESVWYWDGAHWQPTAAGGDVATDAIWDAAGDMIIGTGANTAARVAIGTNGKVWTSNGTTASWAAPSAGGSLTIARFTALDNQPPAANFATLDTRNSIAVLDFDASTDESAVFVGVMPEAAVLTGGISVFLHVMFTSATSGAAVFESSIERCNTDLDSDSFGTVKFASGTANGTSGIITVIQIDHSSSEIDGIVAGGLFRVKISRDANGTNGTDDATGDAELVAVELRGRA